ncbi:ribonuclease HII [Jonesia quinghaiensis]|uniref:ribonuclease HII n=1 Tax=Jonesia quinghaiensis TaxID=262806 RepID=UPI0003FD63DE|nr:ribonuclease HII [Jonesia quinghaiensis]
MTDEPNALFDVSFPVPPATPGVHDIEHEPTLDISIESSLIKGDEFASDREEVDADNLHATHVRARKSPRVFADLTHERSLFDRGARLIAGVDEVGRGALAGPVAVGVCVIDAGTQPPPVGLTDSKELSPEARELFVPMIHGWSVDHAVGIADSSEIDAIGIIGALRLAGQRALGEIMQRIGPVDTVLLDGSHDWLTEPEQDLFDAVTSEPQPIEGYIEPRVVTRVKADLACASVSAASIIAKEYRDAMMRDLDRDHPQYGWVTNKGYASSGHTYALSTLGPTPYHRVSWNLPGVDPAAHATDKA